MRVARLVAIVGLSFLAGAASQGWLAPVASAQGQLQPLKQVDLGPWCSAGETEIVLFERLDAGQRRELHQGVALSLEPGTVFYRQKLLEEICVARLLARSVLRQAGPLDRHPV